MGVLYNKLYYIVKKPRYFLILSTWNSVYAQWYIYTVSKLCSCSIGTRVPSRPQKFLQKQNISQIFYGIVSDQKHENEMFSASNFWQ